MEQETQLPTVRPSRRARDQQLRRLTRQLRKLSPSLDQPEFMPVLRSFGRVTLLLERSYEELRGRSLLDENGELRSSITTVRQLADTQMKMAKELGLTPSSIRGIRKAPIDLAAAIADAEIIDG